jgi:hypothetical protein
MNTDKFKIMHYKIVTGNIQTTKGSYSVNMSNSVFHVGRTNVDYSINNHSVTYNLFTRDGFWDPDFIDELTLGKLGVPFCQPDGPGPNLERFGGKPFRYIPTTITFPF